VRPSQSDHPADAHRPATGHSDGGYTFASKIASAAAEFSSRCPRCLHAAGFILFALTFIVHAACSSSSRRKGQRRMTQTTLDTPRSAPTFHASASSAKLKNNLATHPVHRVLPDRCCIPLVWLLYTVIRRRGFSNPGLVVVDAPLAGCCRTGGRRRVPRDVRPIAQALIAAVLSVPLG